MSTKRDDILHAATTLFASRGLHGASVPHILQLANASAGAMYSYFESKEVLAVEVCRRAQQRFHLEVVRDFPASLPLTAQLDALWARLLAFAAAHPSDAALLFLIHWNEELVAQHADLDPLQRRALGLVITPWCEDELLAASNPESVLSLVLGAFLVLLHDAQRSGQVITPAHAAEVRELLWRALMSPGGRAD